MAAYTLNAEPGQYNLTGHDAELEASPVTFDDIGSPVARMVMTFLGAAAGLTPVYDAKNYPDFLKNTAGVFRGVVAGNVSIDLHPIIDDLRNGLVDSTDAVNSLCCMLAAGARAAMEDELTDVQKRHPTIQFLRHVRNAGAHGNKWHFDANNPTQPAHWRKFVIDHTLKHDKNPLFGKPCFGADFGPADLIALLADVEHFRAGG